MKIRVFGFLTVDVPTVIGEDENDVLAAKEIAMDILLPSVLETKSGQVVITEGFIPNTAQRVYE